MEANWMEEVHPQKKPPDQLSHESEGLWPGSSRKFKLAESKLGKKAVPASASVLSQGEQKQNVELPLETNQEPAQDM